MAQIALEPEHGQAGGRGRTAAELAQELVDTWTGLKPAQAGSDGGRAARVVGKSDQAICGLLAEWCAEVEGVEEAAELAAKCASLRAQGLEEELQAREAQRAEGQAAVAREREKGLTLACERAELEAEVDRLTLRLKRATEESEAQRGRVRELEMELGGANKENQDLRQRLQQARASQEDAKTQDSRAVEALQAALLTERSKAEQLRAALQRKEREMSACEGTVEQLQAGMAAVERGLGVAMSEAAASKGVMAALEDAMAAEARSRRQVRQRRPLCRKLFAASGRLSAFRHT
jgi:chromosome segregation ATPase